MKKTIAAIFLLFLCFVTYGDILTHRFMVDDRIYIKPAATVFTYYQDLGDFFKKPFDQHYNPLNYLFETTVFGLFQKPLPLYLINLLLFYADCVLLFIFVYLISGAYSTALLTSIFFCVHPMTGDMLQHTTYNALLLQAVFIESALIALYLYVKHHKPLFYYFFSILMVAIALFCHEMIMVFPLYAAALLFFLTDIKIGRMIRLIMPFVFLSMALIVLWLILLNPRVHLENIVLLSPSAFWHSSANFSRVFFWYLGNLFVPRTIVMYCLMPPLHEGIWLWNLLLFGFWAGCGLCLFCYAKRSLEAFALTLFLIGFILTVPAAQERFHYGGEWVFEPNWVYFSSIGFYLFMILMFCKLKKYINKTLWIALLAAFLLSYFISTVRLNVISRTEISYAENWHRKFPCNRTVMNIIASFYYNHKDVDIPSDLIPGMVDLVISYNKTNFPGVPKLIGRVLSGRISLTQRKALFYQLAAYHCKNGHQDQCEAIIHRIIGPQRDPYTYVELSDTLYTSGADTTAIYLLKQCIALYPKYAEPYLLIGVILANEGHNEESIHFLKQGAALNPADSRFVGNMDKVKHLLH